MYLDDYLATTDNYLCHFIYGFSRNWSSNTEKVFVCKLQIGRYYWWIEKIGNQNVRKFRIGYYQEIPSNLRICPKCYAHLSKNYKKSLPLELRLRCEQDTRELERGCHDVSQSQAVELPQDRIEVQDLVGLLDLELGDEIVYYVVRRNLESGSKRPIAHGSGRMPTLPARLKLLSTDSPLGSQLIGKFVGDEFAVRAPGGIVSYRVLWTQKIPSGSDIRNSLSLIERSDKVIYEGRGKNDVTQSTTIDGSRYVGFLARDGNEWGSFCMHDDYGDEADAEGYDYDE